MSCEARTYFLLSVPTIDNMTAPRDWNPHAPFCNQCAHWNLDDREFTVSIEQVKIRPEPLTLIFGLNVTLIHHELFESLGSYDAFKTFKFGRIKLGNGKIEPNWKIVYHSFINILRGTKTGMVGDTFKVSSCLVCNRATYFAMGKRHLGERPRSGEHVFPSSFGELIVDDIALARIDRARWKKLKVIPLPVLDKPLDGLPNNLWSEEALKKFLPNG
jgi:hypothetical protein